VLSFCKQTNRLSGPGGSGERVFPLVEKLASHSCNKLDEGVSGTKTKGGCKETEILKGGGGHEDPGEGSWSETVLITEQKTT